MAHHRTGVANKDSQDVIQYAYQPGKVAGNDERTRTMFTITLNDNTASYTRLNDATRRANTLAARDGVEVKVVHAETSSVVFITSPARQRVEAEGGEYNPWTRVEQPKHAAPDFDGYVPAYSRKKIAATVYRKNDFERGGDNWRVFDGRTGKFRDVRDTKAACKLTTAMKDMTL